MNALRVASASRRRFVLLETSVGISDATHALGFPLPRCGRGAGGEGKQQRMLAGTLNPAVVPLLALTPSFRSDKSTTLSLNSGVKAVFFKNPLLRFPLLRRGNRVSFSVPLAKREEPYGGG